MKGGTSIPLSALRDLLRPTPALFGRFRLRFRLIAQHRVGEVFDRLRQLRDFGLLAHAISDRNECLICSTFFRRILIDAGEDPGELRLDEDDELIGFGAIMVATNVFNDALGVPLDDYLQPYRKAA